MSPQIISVQMCSERSRVLNSAQIHVYRLNTLYENTCILHSSENVSFSFFFYEGP